MSQEIKLNKDTYDKNQYVKVIDTSFKQLGVKTVQEIISKQPTVDDFFSLYNSLFYNIPELGDINSHEFLINKSSEYINFQSNNEEIEALQAEITQLRIDLLDEQKKVIELQTNQKL
jgi:hypothetical protein